MRLKKEFNLIKMISAIFSFGYLLTASAFAQELNCLDKKASVPKAICSSSFREQRQKLETQTVTTYIVTDAPIRLLQDTHSIWLKQLHRCKSLTCYQQQIDNRTDQLNFFASLNQSLTQHYLKIEQGQLPQKPVHLQIHTLSKNNIKVEGIAYLNPNNKLEKQTTSLLAYSTVDQKSEITDNNNNCKYYFKYSKAYLSVTSKQKGCETFVGVYRLYD